MIDKFTNLFLKLNIFAIFSLAALIVYDAFMRYAFNSGSIALQELEWHLFDLIIMISIAYTLKERSHVRVDIFYEHYQKRTQILVSIFSLIFFIIPFSMLLIYFSYDFVMQSYLQDEISSNPGGLSFRYLIKSVIIVAFCLLIIQSISEISKLYKEFRQC